MILAAPHKIAHYTERGWWGTTTLWDLFVRNLRQQPQAEAVVDAVNRAEFAPGPMRRLSWQALAAEVDRFCLLLLELGVQRDEVLLVQLPNGVEQYIVYLACARLGVIVSPLPVQYREHELKHILELTQAVAVVTFERIGPPHKGHAAAAMWRGLQSCHASLRQVLAWDADLPARLPPLDATAKLRLAQAESAAAVTANDVFTVCWTSGTQAAPKGVPRSHNEWLIVAPSIIEAGSIPARARLLNPFALINMAGFSTAFATWLVLGATVIQHQPFSLPVFLRQLREESIDYTVAPPAILNTLLQNHDLLQGIDFSRLKRIGSGSAPLSDWMVRGFAQRYGVHIINYFGSNEGAALSGNEIDIPDPTLRAQFFPRAGVQGYNWHVSTTRKIRTRLVDPLSETEIHHSAQVGELRFDGPTIFSGYFRAPELSQSAFDALGYYKSGDLFEIAGEHNQYYRYVGRAKDLVLRGGMNISSEEVENLLLACPGVREAAVVAVPDARLGEKVCACVVAQPEHKPTLAELVRYLRDEKRVAIYKCPEYLLLLDALPRNPLGKVLKRELRLRAQALASEPAAQSLPDSSQGPSKEIT